MKIYENDLNITKTLQNKTTKSLNNNNFLLDYPITQLNGFPLFVGMHLIGTQVSSQ